MYPNGFKKYIFYNLFMSKRITLTIKCNILICIGTNVTNDYNIIIIVIL